MTYPSHMARSALRNALRNHPDARTVLAGRLVNNLTLAELNKCLETLGFDFNSLAAADIASLPPAPGCDNPPHEVTVMADDPIETAVAEIRSMIVTGGFTALDQRLRELVTEARKPPVEVRVEIPVEVSGPCGTTVISRPTGKTETWRKLFGIRDGSIGDRTTATWDGAHPSTPKINEHYVWPTPATAIALTQFSRGRNVMLFGPAGTGKTEFAQQLAARTGRPFALISCDNGTDAATLVGMTVPDPAGGVTWQDGQLTRAIQTPGCVVCIDEPSVARPGALFVMQNVLANRQLFIAETGRRINVAQGVIFIATDNTNGTGGGARRGYTDTNRLNAAFLDRFGVRLRIDYLPTDKEAKVIVDYTGCPLALAELLVKTAALTRAAEANQTISHGIGLRRLLSWAECLMDGVPAVPAFEACVLNAASEQDIEPLREQCLMSYDAGNVSRALNATGAGQDDGMAINPVSDPSQSNPTPAGRQAARDFAGGR